MIILYVLLVAYILAVNFYAFLLVKSLRDKEKEKTLEQESASACQADTNTPKPTEKYLGKLLATGALGGAITIYVCMFLLKYKRFDMLLMLVMPLLGVLNVYLFVLLFRSGFGFLLIR